MVGVPLLLNPLAVYNILIFLMPGVALTAPLLTLTLISGAAWSVTLSDFLLAAGILLLLLEIVKAARPGSRFVMDHLLSFVIFAAACAEFLLLPPFGTSTYFLLGLLTLVDFLGGLALRVRRGRLVARAPEVRSGARPVAQPPEQPSEAVVSSAPAPVEAASPVPSAASIAESVLMAPSKPISPGPQNGTGEGTAHDEAQPTSDGRLHS